MPYKSWFDCKVKGTLTMQKGLLLLHFCVALRYLSRFVYQPVCAFAIMDKASFRQQPREPRSFEMPKKTKKSISTTSCFKHISQTALSFPQGLGVQTRKKTHEGSTFNQTNHPKPVTNFHPSWEKAASKSP